MPSRMLSIRASIEGRITIPIKPVRKKWMPTSTRRSFAVHPFRLVVWLKITDEREDLGEQVDRSVQQGDEEVGAVLDDIQQA